MVIQAEGPFLVHAHVECRNHGNPWWRYARPVVSTNALLVSVLTGAADPDGDVVSLLGVPFNCSADVRDDYTLRIAADWTQAHAPRTLERHEARELQAAGLGRRWNAPDRVVDPAFAHATWLDRRELDRVLRMYESLAFDSAPATWCAALSMMSELERDYEVRLILWLERLVPVARGARPAVAGVAHARR